MGFDITWMGNNVIVSLSGKVSFKDIDTADGMLYGDARFEKMEYQIFDHTDVEEFNVSTSDLQMIGALDKSSSIWNRKMKVALVTRDKKIMDHIEEYKKVMKDTGWKIRAFDTLEEAKFWCNSNQPG
jgi:hypothetical protein